MATKIFVNLPVHDLAASVAFFTRLGFRFDARMTNEQGTCMVVSEDIYVMLLTRPFFQSFTPKPVVDAHQGNEAILCFGVESRAEVDRIADAALAAGGQPIPQQQEDFMYDRAFQDLDGHLWNVMYMDVACLEQPAAAETTTA